MVTYRSLRILHIVIRGYGGLETTRVYRRLHISR
jgi:hypothetical protein